MSELTAYIRAELPCEACGHEAHGTRTPVIADVEDRLDGARTVELLVCHACEESGEGWPIQYRGTTCVSTIRGLVAS